MGIFQVSSKPGGCYLSRKDKVLHSTMLVTLVIILSKAIGFIRDMVTTAYFGATMENDAYVSAYSLFYLPVLLFNSCISATLIPMYVSERNRYSLDHSNRFASNAINLFAVFSLIVSAVMLVLAKPLVHLVYSGFNDEKLALTAKLVRIMVLALVFNVTSITVSNMLNAMEKFIAAQLTGFPLSLFVIGASVFFSGKYGITAVAWGVFAANVLQLLILIPFLRGWFHYTPRLNFRDPRFRKLIRLAGPATLSMGVSELNHMIDHALASGLAEGTLTSMTSAYRLITFLQGILIVPLTTIMFSKMSVKVAEKNERGALRMLKRSCLTLTLVMLPIVGVGAVMSSDVIKFAYMRGKFTADDVRVTAGILTFYIIGLPAFGMRDFMNRMFHALGDTKTPFRVSCMVVCINVVLNFVLRAVMGANGLALATSIASYCGMIVLIVLLYRRFGGGGFRKVARELTKMIVSAGLCVVVCMFMSRALPQADGLIHILLRLVVCTAVSLIAYVVFGTVLKIRPLRGAYRFAKKKIRKG